MEEEIYKVDRNAFSVISLQENDGNLEYWLSRTAAERILAVEFLRQQMFGYDPATERLQRVFETAEFKTN